MDTKRPHITELFKHFASVQQNWLSSRNRETQNPVDGLLKQLLSYYHMELEVSILQQALLDPYFPLGMLKRTLFADVVGMRFYINKLRPDLEPVLAVELVEWAAAFLRIRLDIQSFFDPKTITCIPVDGRRHHLPSDQWCTLCGVCCQIGGVPPEPPQDVRYPDHWYTFLAGEKVENLQLCPFLFQHFGEQRFFCAIHNIKPIACRQFDQEECHQRLAERNLHHYSH
jgi:hypothetical protein